MTTTRVLVTGGSGFIAGHCILHLLENGYDVRTTVRSSAREPSVRDVLTAAGMTRGEALTFVEADLMRDEGWADAVYGIDQVLHVASPVQPGHVADEDDLIVPAREGALRVLRAARDAGVSRVVLTSAFHAVSWGWPHDDHVFTEADWTILDGPGVDAYGKSKTLAERAAWDFVAREGGSMELVSTLPVAVMGPIMGHDISGANGIVQNILTGATPGLPDLYIPIVDVRDVASAHLLALTTPEAAGQRLLLSNGAALSLPEIGQTILSGLRASVGGATTDLVARVEALVEKEFRPDLPDIGYSKKTSNAKAIEMLGWRPRPAREAILAAASSMVASGLAASS